LFPLAFEKIYSGLSVYNIARFEDAKEVEKQVGNFHDDILPDIDYEDDELAIV
jgi:hypothetical protein